MHMGLYPCIVFFTSQTIKNGPRVPDSINAQMKVFNGQETKYNNEKAEASTV